uniref:Uncharacterized protein n=1 Tax=Arundo donax TaxID=35708 RepID=A0A0A9B4F0_ARUDO
MRYSYQYSVPLFAELARFFLDIES